MSRGESKKGLSEKVKQHLKLFLLSPHKVHMMSQQEKKAVK